MTDRYRKYLRRLVSGKLAPSKAPRDRLVTANLLSLIRECVAWEEEFRAALSAAKNSDWQPDDFAFARECLVADFCGLDRPTAPITVPRSAPAATDPVCVPIMKLRYGKMPANEARASRFKKK